MVNLGSPWTELAIGLVLSGGIAGLGLKGGALSRSGFVAALFVGTVTFGFGGPAWGFVLVCFFVSSSLLSRLGREHKRDAALVTAKGSRRDAWQVLANGGMGALLAVLSHIGPEGWATIPFVASVAAATADTWATEVGTLGRAQPRLITTGRRAVRGASGAVSPVGTLASLAGAGFIGMAALGTVALDPTGPAAGGAARVLLGAVIGGMTGSLIDSVLGATLQAAYLCEACGRTTEKQIHGCGARTRQIKGLAWINNDVVNLVCTGAGAAVGLILGMPGAGW